jgi:hypothetical protein
MKLSLKGLKIGLIPVLAACQLQAVKQPALLQNPSQQEVDKIRAIISQALDNKDVRLSHGIFSQTNMLIIERAPLKANPHLLSADDKPNHFQLFKDNFGCFVYHKQTEKIWRLQGSHCVPYGIDEDSGDSK